VVQIFKAPSKPYMAEALVQLVQPDSQA